MRYTVYRTRTQPSNKGNIMSRIKKTGPLTKELQKSVIHANGSMIGCVRKWQETVGEETGIKIMDERLLEFLVRYPGVIPSDLERTVTKEGYLYYPADSYAYTEVFTFDTGEKKILAVHLKQVKLLGIGDFFTSLEKLGYKVEQIKRTYDFAVQKGNLSPSLLPLILGYKAALPDLIRSVEVYTLDTDTRIQFELTIGGVTTHIHVREGSQESLISVNINGLNNTLGELTRRLEAKLTYKGQVVVTLPIVELFLGATFKRYDRNSLVRIFERASGIQVKETFFNGEAFCQFCDDFTEEGSYLEINALGGMSLSDLDTYKVVNYLEKVAKDSTFMASVLPVFGWRAETPLETDSSHSEISLADEYIRDYHPALYGIPFLITQLENLSLRGLISFVKRTEAETTFFYKNSELVSIYSRGNENIKVRVKSLWTSMSAEKLSANINRQLRPIIDKHTGCEIQKELLALICKNAQGGVVTILKSFEAEGIGVESTPSRYALGRKSLTIFAQYSVKKSEKIITVTLPKLLGKETALLCLVKELTELAPSYSQGLRPLFNAIGLFTGSAVQYKKDMVYFSLLDDGIPLTEVLQFLSDNTGFLNYATVSLRSLEGWASVTDPTGIPWKFSVETSALKILE